MNRDDLAVSERLARIRSLLSELAGPLGNGEMLVWVNPGDAASVPQEVFSLIDGAASLLERWESGGVTDQMPANATNLMTKLTEVGQAAADGVSVWLMSTTIAYGGRGRYENAKAREIVKTLGRLLGHRTRRWANTEPPGPSGARVWNPVTR